MRCNYNDLTCQEYAKKIIYLSQSARCLSRRKALRHGLRRVPPHPAVRAARDARHRLLGAIGQDRASADLRHPRDGAAIGRPVLGLSNRGGAPTGDREATRLGGGFDIIVFVVAPYPIGKIAVRTSRVAAFRGQIEQGLGTWI